jgi:predicted metalloprotease
MGGLGLGGGVIALILSLVFGGDIFSGGDGTTTATSGGQISAADSAREEPMVQFVSFVLDSTQSMWARKMSQMGEPYHDATLVLFRDVTQSGCGLAQSTMGPFYCPLDEKVYIDLGFYDELRNRLGAGGDFAQAYVIAHELGHHVQHLMGTDERVRQLQQRQPDLANAASVRLELQADCYAGVWGHETDEQRILEPGDVQEGLDAAAAVGDDRLKRMSTGRVNAETFTHGTSEQRMRWFSRGLQSGDPRSCDTFNARSL